METNLEEIKVEQKPLGAYGLGGWLILVQIGLYTTFFIGIFYLFYSIIPIFSQGTWSMLTSIDSVVYHKLWGPVILFETVYNIFMLIFIVFILINFYSKKSVLPRLMIIFYSVGLLFGIVDYILLQFIPLAKELNDASSIRDIIKTAVTCAIWIPYFLKSERVENTFTR